MGLTKIHKILKKYKELHKKHVDSWEEKQEKIRKDGGYRNITADHALEGSKIFDRMMGELENQEIFPKKNNHLK